MQKLKGGVISQYRINRRCERGLFGQNFVYIENVGNQLPPSIYVHRRNTNYFNLKTRPRAIQQARDVQAGLLYNHSLTSANTSSNSRLILITSQQQIALQISQQVNNTYINTSPTIT